MILPLYAESQNLCPKRRRFFLRDAEIRAAIAANCRNGRKVDNRKICVKKQEKCYTFLPDYRVKRFFMSSKCLAGLFLRDVPAFFDVVVGCRIRNVYASERVAGQPYDDDEKICSEKGGVFKTYALRYGTYCDFSGKGKE